MKKMLHSLLSGAALCAAGLLSAAETVPAAAVAETAPVQAAAENTAVTVEGTVTASLLNVRLKPELAAPAVTKLRRGTKVAITGEKGGFYEIVAPASTPVYVSAIYLRDGVTLSPVVMRIAMAQKAESYGMLKRGTRVNVESVSRYDWARITPPETLRLYAAKTYITAAGPIPSSAPAVQPVQKPAEQPVRKPAEQPVRKPAEQPVQKPAEQPVQKPAEQPVQKTAVPSQNPVEVPADQTVDPAVKKTEVSGVAAEAEQKGDAEEKSASDGKEQKEAAPSQLDAALKELGIDLSAGKAVTAAGYFAPLTGTTTPTVRYALLKEEQPEKYVNTYFVCAEDAASLARLANENVELTGVAYTVPGWKTPVLKVERAKLLK